MTHITTEQAVELADKATTVTGYLDFQAFANSAITHYINSLAEGLPEPVDFSDVPEHAHVWGYKREQLIEVIAARESIRRNDLKKLAEKVSVMRFERNAAIKERDAAIAEVEHQKTLNLPTVKNMREELVLAYQEISRLKSELAVALNKQSLRMPASGGSGAAGGYGVVEGEK